MVSKAWMSVLGLIFFGLTLPFSVVAQRSPDRFPPSPPDVVLSAPARSAGPRALALTDTSGGIPLADGWNLVAVPREPADPAPDAALAPLGGALARAFSYDACDPDDPWKLYDPADPGAADLERVDPSVGLWIEAATAAVLPADGPPPLPRTIHLCPGWNLFGASAQEALPPAVALQSIQGKYLRVFGFAAADSADPWEVHDVAVPAWANDLKLLQPGRAYWILMTEEADLELSGLPAAPAVALSSPLDGATVTAPSDVIGTIASDLLESWTLRHRPAGEDDWTEIARGTAPVAAGRVGRFDPTLLLNGLYEIELAAVDSAGREVSAAAMVVVDGTMKIGNFTLPVLDLELPVLGVPLQVIRTYDSRDKRRGDFGVGWTLSLSGISVRESVAPGLRWQGTTSGGNFPNYCILPTRAHVVSIVFPDGKVFRFQPRVVPECQALAPQQVVRIEYVPLAGTQASLTPVGLDREALVVGSFPGGVELWDQGSSDLHDPEAYDLTLPDGRVFSIRQDGGLSSITDPDGNRVTFGPGGIQHSTGVGVAFERDGEDRISRITIPSGASITYEYDGQGDLVRVTGLTNEATSYTYLEDHYLHQIRDAAGRTMSAQEYDGDGRLVKSCGAGSSCLELVHHLDENEEVRIDATGRSATFTYDNRGNVTAVKDGLGHTRTYRYDGFGNVLEEIDPLGARTTHTYDERGNRLSTTGPHPAGADPAHTTVHFSYDERNLLTGVRLPDGTGLRYSHDAAGNLTEVRDEADNVVESSTYGPGGVLTSEASLSGTTAYGDFDAQGRPRLVTGPDGIETELTYDSNGYIAKMVIDGSVTYTFQRDARGRTLRADYGGGMFGELAYQGDDPAWTELKGWNGGPIRRQMDANGRLSAVVNADGSSIGYERDAAGRMVAQTDPAGREVRYEHDAAGRVRAVVDSDGRTEIVRDAAGRILETAGPLGQRTRYEYGTDGRLARLTDPLDRSWTFRSGLGTSSVTDPLHRTTTATVSPGGRGVRQELADGTTREITYLAAAAPDERGDLPVSYRDEGGRERAYGYSGGALSEATDLGGNRYLYGFSSRAQGRTQTITGPTGEAVLTRDYGSNELAAETYADGATTRYEYGAGVRTIRRPSGVTIQEIFDEVGRLTARTTSLGGSTTLDWSEGGELRSVRDASGTTTFDHDASGLLTGLTSQAGTVEYARDVLGRVTRVTVRNGSLEQAATYAYDAVGRLTSVVDPLGGTTRLEYDAGDRLTRRTLPNGVVTEVTYDLRDQILSMIHRGPDGTVLASVAYDRAPGGEPRRITREDGSTVDLSYDAALRLTGEERRDARGAVVEALAYTYDAAGNRLSRTDGAGSRTYTYLPGYRLAASSSPAGDESYAHDAEGRVREITREGDTWELAWDEDDRLSAVTGRAGGPVAYTHDADGRRVRAVLAGGERRMLVAPILGDGLDGNHLIVDGGGGPLAGYVYAGGLPLLRIESGDSTYYLTDAQGSVIALADARGARVARFAYDGFGRLLESEGPAASLPAGAGGDFRFQGMWLDAASGHYHARAREYDPETGRFLSRDPAEPDPYVPESVHPYLFAYANPHVYSDPTGLFGMVEINVSNMVQQNMRYKEVFKIHLQQHLRDKVEEAAQEFLLNAALDFVGLAVGDPDSLKIPGLGSDWEGIERGFQKAFCQVLGDLAPQFLWFEPRIKENGTPLSNGWQCPADDVWPEKTRPGLMTPGERFPDLAFTRGTPMRPRPKALAVGEIKASVQKFHYDYVSPGKRHGQFLAMKNYQIKKGFPPGLVMLFAFDGKASQVEWQSLERLAFNGVRPVGMVIFSVYGKKAKRKP